MKRDVMLTYLSLAIVLVGIGLTVVGCAHECFVSERTVLNVIQK